ncbi:MAG: outer membrane beta-barrel protein [Crocinitomicaceae bacterium]|nr:outer membrane beta-barrel protein [Crocinitomicaceae bacterium]
MRSILLFSLLLVGSSLLAQETKTSIGFSLNPSYSSVLYQKTGTFSDADIELIESGTNGQLGLSGTFFFQYKLTDKLFIDWGLGLQNYRYNTTYYSQTNIEHSDIQRDTKYSQYYIQFNTSLKYRLFKTLYVRAGIGIDLLADHRAERTETCPTCEYNYQGIDNSAIYKEAIFPASFGLGYELKLKDNLNLMAELFGSMSLSDAFMTTLFTDQVQELPGALLKQHLHQRPFQVGCKIGIIRSF